MTKIIFDLLRYMRYIALKLFTKPKYELIDTPKLKYFSDSNKPTFFGYHDQTPFSLDNSKVLAVSVGFKDYLPENECKDTQIGYFNKSETGSFKNNFVHVANTNTWCWQQGCILQWHPKNAIEK